MRSKLSAIGRTVLVVAVVVLIMAAGAAGYAANSSRTVVSTFTTTLIVGTYDVQQITSNVTITKTTMIIEGGKFLEYNFTGNGPILENDLLGLFENYTTTYASSTHLQWVNNGTGFNFNATSASSTCMIGRNNSIYDCSLILNGFGAAYFGNGQKWANSSRWVGTFVINNSSPSNVVSYFSALESFLSMRGLKLVSTSSGIPQGLVTVTKLVIISYVESLAAYTSGTCSWVAGTAFINSSVTTEYIFPSNINDTSQQQFLNITITTVTSNLTNLTSSTTTTITLGAASQSTSTTCPFGV
jgi:hypothetical protein